jgi:hypothetical protein
MFNGILVMAIYASLFIMLGFIVMATLNVREHIAKNRRITRELNDQRRWERFSNYDGENR